MNLTLTRLGMRDYGSYRCRANNSEGTAEASIRVFRECVLEDDDEKGEGLGIGEGFWELWEKCWTDGWVIR